RPPSSTLFPYTTLFRSLLSDGAFKIYVYVCLHADRRTAQLRFRMAELAHATGHSTRSLTSYLEELRSREVSIVYRAANQHELGRSEEHTSELQSRENLV